MEETVEDYADTIRKFREWLFNEFIVEQCADGPKSDGCLSCEALLASRSLSAMEKILHPTAHEQIEG